MVIAAVLKWEPQRNNITYLLSQLRASNCWRDWLFALVRKRHLTLSCVRHIIMRRYGTLPRQWPRPPLLVPHWTPAGAFVSTCCCCSSVLLSSTLRSLSTSIVKNSMSFSSRTGFRWSHSDVCKRVQLLGRGTGTISNKLARRTISFT